jgi:hypothetical protein
VRRKCPFGDYSKQGMRDAPISQGRRSDAISQGLGPHSFRRANITWRQQVGGSAIEASKIAGHSDLEMTGEYTCVSPERQNELTRRIQRRVRQAGRKNGKQKILESQVSRSEAPDPSSNVERAVAPMINRTLHLALCDKRPMTSPQQ